jgi:hypothetical protein
MYSSNLAAVTHLIGSTKSMVRAALLMAMLTAVRMGCGQIKLSSLA